MDKDELKKRLTPEEYKVTQEGGTEAAFSGAYWDHHEDGMYTCKVCRAPLFSSATKFDSGTGWPSFIAPVDKENILEELDKSHGMVRTEVKCRKCGAHLGHVFPDGPDKMSDRSVGNGQRFCINSCSLDFKEKNGN